VATVQTIFSGVLALFTAVLAVVTWLYYKETKSHTKEMKKSRESEFKPVLQSKINHLYGIHYRFSIRNVGKGSAHNVKAKWGFEGIDNEEEWEIPLIVPGQEHEFAFPFKEDKFGKSTQEQIEEALEEVSGNLYFSYECEDSLGKEFNDVQELNVLDKIKGRTAGELVQKDEQKQIRKAIEDLQDSVDGVADKIEMSGMEELIRSKNVQKVIDILEQEKKISVGALSNLSGIKQKELVSILQKLKNEGIIEYSEDLNPVMKDSREVELTYKG
jgi:predicted transcriptional regulator